jgi:hypothetical protein
MTNPDLNIKHPHPVGLPNPYPLKSNPIQKIPPIPPTNELVKQSDRKEVEYLDQILTEEWDYYHLGHFDADRI